MNLNPTLNPKVKVACCGLVCLDIFPDLSKIEGGDFDAQFRPGRVVETAGTHFHVGGSATNTGISLHRLGVGVTIVGLIGADFYGAIIRRIYEREDPQLADGLIIIPELASGHTYIIEPYGIDRRFLIHAGVNDAFAADTVRDEVLRNIGLLHFGYPSVLRRMILNDGAEVEKLYRKAKQFGLITSLDTAVPDPNSFSGRIDWRRLLERSLPFVDLFVPSFEELVYMLDRNRYDRLYKTHDVLAAADLTYLDDLSAQVLAMGTKINLIKIGNRGLYLRTADHAAQHWGRLASIVDVETWRDLRLYQPAFEVDVAGTTGAGDAAIAGFISGLIRGYLPEEVMMLSAGAGACCCEQPDSVGGVPSWEALCERIGTGWKMNTEDGLG